MAPSDQKPEELTRPKLVLLWLCVALSIALIWFSAVPPQTVG